MRAHRYPRHISRYSSNRFSFAHHFSMHESPPWILSTLFPSFFFSSLIPTFHQSVMEFLSRFEFETHREREKMGGIVSFKDRSPIFSILFRFLLSLFPFFMKFSIGKLPFRTFSCDSPRGRFYFFSHVLVSSLKMTR